MHTRSITTSTLLAALFTAGTAFAQGNPLGALNKAAHQQLAECTAKIKPLHDAVIADFNKAKAAGKIDVPAERQFADIDQRTKARYAQMAANKLTYVDCEVTLRDLENEKAAIAKMMAVVKPTLDPKLASCISENERRRQEAVGRYTGAANSGWITFAERDQFNRYQKNLADFQAVLARDGLTLDECMRIRTEIDNMMDFVKRAAKPSK